MSFSRLVGAVVVSAALAGPAPAPGQDAGAGLAARADAALPLLDVPFISQSEALCGGAAVAMALRYWGERSVHAGDFAHLVVADGSGIRTSDLEEAIVSRGWRTLPVTDAVEGRRQLARGRPVIVLIEDRPGWYHYVVVVAWSEGGVLYHDPARGPDRASSAADFDRVWRAAGRWAVAILPGPGVAMGPAGDGSAGSDTGAPAVADGSARTGSMPSCASLVRRGVELARTGRERDAERFLLAAVTDCAAAEAHFELAGLRFRQERWADAAALAARAVAGGMTEPIAWRLLATSRYLAGDEEGALRAWNRLGQPRIDLVRVSGLNRTRHRVVERAIGLEAGRVIGPEDLRRARRRLAALPAAAATRLDYVPVDGGALEVDIAVHEYALLASSWPEWTMLAAGAAVSDRVELRAASLLGAGEAWTATGQWRASRAGAALGLAAPGPGGSGTWRLEAGWQREIHGSPSSAVLDRPERIRLAFRASDWATDALRWSAGLALERWNGRDRAVEARMGVELRAGPRLALELGAGGRAGLDSHPLVPWVAGTARWRSRVEETKTVLDLSGRVSATRSAAPRMLWDGAGAGHARAALLRAHPLSGADALDGPVLGPVLAAASIEVRRWLPEIGPFRPGGAAFLDVAAAERHDPHPAGRAHADAGLGVRLGIPGQPGYLRLDGAVGLRDGRRTLSVGWVSSDP